MLACFIWPASVSVSLSFASNSIGVKPPRMACAFWRLSSESLRSKQGPEPLTGG